MFRLLVCLVLVATTVAAEGEDYPQGSMWLLDSPVPVERSQRSAFLTRSKEKSVGQGGHFPFYRGLGRK